MVALEELVRRAREALEQEVAAPVTRARVIQARRLGGSGQQLLLAVTLRGPPKRELVVKCFQADGAEGEARVLRRASKEIERAIQASRAGLGAPVLSATSTERFAYLATPQGLGDLEQLLQARHHLPLRLLQDLVAKAFRLCAHPWLTKNGHACFDLKPANVVVYGSDGQPFRVFVKRLASLTQKGRPSECDDLSVRLIDFDPVYWAKVPSSDCALLNTTILLLNLVSWHTVAPLGPYLPAEAHHLACELRKRDPRLKKLLLRHESLLRRGPLYYLLDGKSDVPSRPFWSIVEARLKYHAVGKTSEEP